MPVPVREGQEVYYSLTSHLWEMTITLLRGEDVQNLALERVSWEIHTSPTVVITFSNTPFILALLPDRSINKSTNICSGHLNPHLTPAIPPKVVRLGSRA